MFFSVQHLIGQDAKFALVWRAATSGSAKKLPRRAVQGVSVPSMCREILKFTPSGSGSDEEVTSKFALYLLGQLMYGTVLIFERQVHLFEVDARSAFESCKRFTIDELLNLYASGSETVAVKKRRRGKVANEVVAAEIDVNEPPESRFVGLARRSEITLVESEPIIWQRQDLFQYEIPAPVDFSKEHFIDWNDQRSSNGSKQSQITTIDQRKVPLTEPLLLDQELPPFPPPESFHNMIRESFMAGTQSLTELQEVAPRPVNAPEGVVDNHSLTEVEPNPKRPRVDETSARPSSLSTQTGTEAPLKPSLELSPLDKEHEAIQEKLHPLRRRSLKLANGITIPYDTMKEMQSDYSSLLKTREELRVFVDKRPSVRELLQPYPAYAGRKFPKECIALYRSRFSDNLTFAQALTESIYDPVYRGPAAFLWHYSGSELSSKEGSEYDVSPGIAYLSQTPDRVRAGSHSEESSSSRERSRRSDKGSSALLTPGQVSVFKTPTKLREVPFAEVGQGDIPGRDQSFPPVPGDSAALAADVTLPHERKNMRESRSSYLEQARRMTRGTVEMEGRPSSVQLYDPMQQNDLAQLSMSSTSERQTLSPSLKDLVKSAEGRLIYNTAISTNRPVPISLVIPYTTTSKKQAAAVFSRLLALAGKGVVGVKQHEPFGEIWYSLRSPSTSTDHDTTMQSHREEGITSQA